MARPANRDVECYRGDSYEHQVSFVEADGTTPIDLSAHSFAASLRTAPDAAVTVAFTIDDTDSNLGQVTLSLAPASTAALTKALYLYDVESTLAGAVTTRLRGKFVVTKDIT